MLSARGGVESAGEGFAVGPDDYVAKPFSSQDLINRVAARLDAAARSRSSSERHSEFVDRYHVLSLDAPVPAVQVIRTNQPMVISDTLDLDQRNELVVRDAAIAATTIGRADNPDSLLRSSI